MSGSIEEKLLQAIQKDDVKAFNALMGKAQCGRYRLGRFPVLSIMYLYNARKIISAYEERFIKITAWKELRELASVAKLFSDKAGKCLRLYLNEVVSPLEMLLILDNTKRLKKLYPQTKAPEAVKLRLQSIYSVKYSLDIDFDGNDIIIEKRPLSYTQKRRIIAACLGGLAAVALAVATPVTVVSLLPEPVEGEVTRLRHIDFSSQTTYTLKKDIKIPKNFSAKEINCTIIGDGNKLIFAKGATLGEFNGELRNLEIQTSGSPIFSVCTESAVLSDVTVNVNAAIEIKDNSAFVAVTNCGTFDGVTVNVSGNVSAREGSADEIFFGGIVGVNSYSYTPSLQRVYGTIKNCTVTYTDFSLKGELMANASFGGIVGINSGVVQDCTVKGKIVSHTFDMAGACYYNGNSLSRIVNEADLSQTSEDEGWSPIIGGIVIESSARVEYCKNTGNISIVGQSTAISGGIVARTYGKNNYCISSGNITVTAPDAYVGGIFGRSEVVIDGWYIYCGFADHCISESKISVTLGEEPSCVGGVGGLVQERKITMVDGEGNFIEDIYYGGGITDCIFMGAIEGDFNYYGNIVGVCGLEVYEQNSYTSDNKEYPNFNGNYYLGNGLPSFGATVNSDEEFTEVEGKGATSATEDEIKNTKAYQDILKEFGL